MDIALRTEHAKVADIGFGTLERLVGGLVLEGSSWRTVLRVDGVLDSFGPERQRKLRLNEDSADAIHDSKVQAFRDTVLFGGSRRRSLMEDAMFLHIEFPFECHILAAIIGTEYPEFPTGLAFNFLVLGLKSLKRFAFLSEKTAPRVATRVVSKGDEVEFSTERHGRCWSPEICVHEI